jgi:hypothetical protein
MTANIAFALGAAVLSLAIVVGAALKGNWAVAAVYALIVAGFLARASFGRRARREGEQPPPPPGGPRHRPERKLGAARFKRR